ncbi:MAG: IS4 family transposase [Moraxellaceae bacterium]|nr:MAG: IS4 family transposase [Moraxellaceae bacterium]
MNEKRTKKSKDQQSQIASIKRNLSAEQLLRTLSSSKISAVITRLMPAHRNRSYSPTQTLAMFIQQALNADKSCKNVVNQYCVQRILSKKPIISYNTSAYCRARKKLPVAMIQALTNTFAELMHAQESTELLWRGRRTLLVDGSTIAMEDTQANQSQYPQQRRQKPGLGQPIARILGIFSLSNGAVIESNICPFRGKRASELILFREKLDCLRSGDVVVADTYFSSYFMMAELDRRGVDIVTPIHQARKVTFKKGQKLGFKDTVVTWDKPARPKWMTKEQHASYPSKFKVRQIQHKNKCLITTVREPQNASKREIFELYKLRWDVELNLRNIKCTLGMDELTCKTPEMIEKEFAIYLLAYNLIRLIMLSAAASEELHPRTLSFKNSLQLWVQFQAISGNTSIAAIGPMKLALLMECICSTRVAQRSGRIKPRKVKRRPKPIGLLMERRELARAKIRKHGHPKRRK